MAVAADGVPRGRSQAVWPGIDTRRWGIGAVALGVAAQAVGLGIDAWQHARDATLAGREGVFTLSNVGHAVFFGGLVVAAVGVLLAVFGHRLYGPPGRRVQWHARFLQIGAPLAVAALVSGGAVGASNSSLAAGHSHHEDAAATADHEHAPGTPDHEHAAGAGVAGAPSDTTTPVTHEHAATLAAAPSTAPAAPSAPSAPPPAHDHGVSTNPDHAAEEQPDQPLDAATRAALADQLTAARDAALRMPTVADATAAGYFLAGGFAPGSGAHYIGLLGGGLDTFEPGNPGTLIYDGTNPDSRIVGVMYTGLDSIGAPEGFAGPNDHWHRHRNVCIRYGNGQIEVPFPADRDITTEMCRAVDGTFMETTTWMVHAWVVPSWESPLGVFSHDNPNVRCADGTMNTDDRGFCTGT